MYDFMTYIFTSLQRYIFGMQTIIKLINVYFQWLPLENVKTGMIHVRALWLHLSKDPSDLDRVSGSFVLLIRSSIECCWDVCMTAKWLNVSKSPSSLEFNHSLWKQCGKGSEIAHLSIFFLEACQNISFMAVHRDVFKYPISILQVGSLFIRNSFW